MTSTTRSRRQEMILSNQVRQEWVTFQIWLSEQCHALIKQREERRKRLRWIMTVRVATTPSEFHHDIEERYQHRVENLTARTPREELFKRARNEWFARLQRRSLDANDWKDMTAAERESVKNALGICVRWGDEEGDASEVSSKEEEDEETMPLRQGLDQLSFSTRTAPTRYAFVDPSELTRDDTPSNATTARAMHTGTEDVRARPTRVHGGKDLAHTHRTSSHPDSLRPRAQHTTGHATVETSTPSAHAGRIGGTPHLASAHLENDTEKQKASREFDEFRENLRDQLFEKLNQYRLKSEKGLSRTLRHPSVDETTRKLLKADHDEDIAELSAEMEQQRKRTVSEEKERRLREFDERNARTNTRRDTHPYLKPQTRNRLESRHIGLNPRSVGGGTTQPTPVSSPWAPMSSLGPLQRPAPTTSTGNSLVHLKPALKREGARTATHQVGAHVRWEESMNSASDTGSTSATSSTSSGSLFGSGANRGAEGTSRRRQVPNPPTQTQMHSQMMSQEQTPERNEQTPGRTQDGGWKGKGRVDPYDDLLRRRMT